MREKQKEFDELIKNPKPDSINFSDNNEVNNQLNNQVNAQVNNQLNNGDNKTLTDTKDVKQENDTIFEAAHNMYRAQYSPHWRSRRCVPRCR